MTEAVTLDETGRAYVRDLAAKRLALREAEAAAKRAAQRVAEYLGSAEYGLDESGEPLVKRTRVVQHRFDSKRFKDEQPDLAESYTVESAYERIDLA